MGGASGSRGSARRRDRRADRRPDLCPPVAGHTWCRGPADLEELTRIPSVSLDAFDQSHVEDSAEATAALLRAEGLDVEMLGEGGRPAVIGHVDGPPGAHGAALRAPRRPAPWRRRRVGQPALRADRAGRPTLRARRRRRQGRDHGAPRRVAGPRRLPSRRCDRLRRGGGGDRLRLPADPAGEARRESRADAIVLADSTNWAIGEPALTTTLRGPIRIVVTVTTLDHGIHSGMFGAVGLTRSPRSSALARLHDDDGDVAVAASAPAWRATWTSTRPGCVRSPACSTACRRRHRRCRPHLDQAAPRRSGSTPRRSPGPPTRWCPRRAKVSIRLAPGEVDSRPSRCSVTHRGVHPVGCPGRGALDDRGSGSPPTRRGRSTTRRGPPSPMHGGSSRSTWCGWVDPVRRLVRREVPRRRDPRDDRGPRREGPRRQRVAASASSRRSMSPRRCSSPGWEPCRSDRRGTRASEEESGHEDLVGRQAAPQPPGTRLSRRHAVPQNLDHRTEGVPMTQGACVEPS